MDQNHDEDVPRPLARALQVTRWAGTTLICDVAALVQTDVLDCPEELTDFSQSILAGERWWAQLMDGTGNLPEWASRATMEVVCLPK